MKRSWLALVRPVSDHWSDAPAILLLTWSMNTIWMALLFTGYLSWFVLCLADPLLRHSVYCDLCRCSAGLRLKLGMSELECSFYVMFQLVCVNLCGYLLFACCSTLCSSLTRMRLDMSASHNSPVMTPTPQSAMLCGGDLSEVKCGSCSVLMVWCALWTSQQDASVDGQEETFDWQLLVDQLNNRQCSLVFRLCGFPRWCTEMNTESLFDVIRNTSLWQVRQLTKVVTLVHRVGGEREKRRERHLVKGTNRLPKLFIFFFLQCLMLWSMIMIWIRDDWEWHVWWMITALVVQWLLMCHFINWRFFGLCSVWCRSNVNLLLLLCTLQSVIGVYG